MAVLRVFAAGDVLRGPATVVEGIADAAAFAEEVLGEKHACTLPENALPSRETAIARKGILCRSAGREEERCLACSVVCETCADVCPNRANVAVKLPDGRAQILHVDRLCNECGNCAAFCPYDIHLHTVSCPGEEAFRRMQEGLRALGVLLEA